VANLVRRGVDTFILDIPATEEEYAQVSEAFRLAEQLCSCESATANFLAS
jgi:hypothetical protein